MCDDTCRACDTGSRGEVSHCVDHKGATPDSRTGLEPGELSVYLVGFGIVAFLLGVRFLGG